MTTKAEIATLLGRELTELDPEHLSAFSNKTILITGAGGSIGSEIVNTLANIPCHIVAYDRSENNISRLMHQNITSVANITSVLGDINESNILGQTFRTHLPEIVVHAAAYKHLPLLENCPLQAVTNNVFGTKLVMDMAVIYQTQSFVLISTDKAVQPTSVMGATKRLAEMIVLNTSRAKVVRLGNVIGSSGSVLPLFETQIVRGGPITVTHPGATRFFMAPSEAAGLILSASVLNSGNIYVLDMGIPVSIFDLASRLLRIRKRPLVQIMFTGIRPGEKLTEQLFTGAVMETVLPKIWRACDQPVDSRKLCMGLIELRRLLEACDIPGVLDKLQDLVPEYCPRLGAHSNA